ICIQAGWTLPGVQDTYIPYEVAGNRIVGRYVAGLPYGETAFATPPPFFVVFDDEIRQNITLCFPNIHDRLILTGSFLLASLIHRHKVLMARLPAEYPLHQNALFGNTRLVFRLKYRVNCKIATSTDQIRPTEVPPHVQL
ncbi:hypothetical protein PHMEG_00030145, partial [Phytophthora megakarya]